LAPVPVHGSRKRGGGKKKGRQEHPSEKYSAFSPPGHTGKKEGNRPVWNLGVKTGASARPYRLKLPPTKEREKNPLPLGELRPKENDAKPCELTTPPHKKKGGLDTSPDVKGSRLPPRSEEEKRKGGQEERQCRIGEGGGVGGKCSVFRVGWGERNRPSQFPIRARGAPFHCLLELRNDGKVTKKKKKEEPRDLRTPSVVLKKDGWSRKSRGGTGKGEKEGKGATAVAESVGSLQGGGGEACVEGQCRTS